MFIEVYSNCCMGYLLLLKVGNNSRKLVGTIIDYLVSV